MWTGILQFFGLLVVVVVFKMYSWSGLYSFVVSYKSMSARYSYMYITIIKKNIFKTQMPYSESNIKSSSLKLWCFSQRENRCHNSEHLNASSCLSFACQQHVEGGVSKSTCPQLSCCLTVITLTKVHNQPQVQAFTLHFSSWRSGSPWTYKHMKHFKP